MVTGLALELRPEWLLTTSTALPVLVAAAWCLASTSAAWRRALWPLVRDAGAERARPVWCGWRVQFADGEERVVRGGLRGVRWRQVSPATAAR